MLQNRTSGKKLPNVEKFSCITCWNEREFHIAGIERIGNSDWQILLTCRHCLTSMTYRFYGFHWYKRLLKHIKSMISEANKEKPTSYTEWDLRTGKIYRDSHPDGLYEELS